MSANKITKKTGDEEEEISDDNSEESDSDDDDEDDIEDEENEEEDEYPISYTLCEALSDFAGEEQGDLKFKKGDHFTVVKTREDGWWEVINKQGVKGLIPSTFVKVIQESRNLAEGETENNAVRYSQSWKEIKQDMKQTTTDVLSILGAMPVGFQPSSLSALLSKDDRYSIISFIAPKIGKSGLSFKDIQWNPQTNQLLPVSVHIQRIISILALQNIPLPGVGVDITSRHVRICLHDGVKMLSNIHTIEAKYDPKIPKQWTFATKVSTSGSEDSMFVRSNNSSATFGILFQPCISYIRVSSGEKGEISCGWVFMRLLDDSGIAVPNRTKALRVHGGYPFEQIDTSLNQDKKGSLKNLMSKKKCARFLVRIRMPNNDQRQQLELLPATLIGPLYFLPHLVLYRQLLADSLLRDRIASDSTYLVYSPLLGTFPELLKQPDIMDMFMMEWQKKAKSQKRAVKKDIDKLKQQYVQLYMEIVYPLLSCASLPHYQFGDPDIKQERQREIKRIMQFRQEENSLMVMLSSSIQFKPFTATELALDLMGPHCFPLEHT